MNVAPSFAETALLLGVDEVEIQKNHLAREVIVKMRIGATWRQLPLTEDMTPFKMGMELQSFATEFRFDLGLPEIEDMPQPKNRFEAIALELDREH